MKVLFTLLLGGASLLAVGGEQWSLERCISYAIEHNLQIKTADNDVELARLTHEQRAWDYAPSVNGQASYSANFGRSLDPTTYNYIDDRTVNNVNAGVTLNTTLFAGMSKLHNLKYAELNLMASTKDLSKMKNDIMLAVVAAYLEVLYSGELIANSRSQIALIEEQIARTEKLVAAGSAALGALLELQSQLASESYTLVSRENGYAISELTLTQLLELRDVDADEFEVVIPDVEKVIDIEPRNDLQTIFDTAQQLPQIEGAKLRRDAAERNIDIARAKLYPTLSFSAAYGSSYSDARQKPTLGPGGEVNYLPYPFINQLSDNASSALQFSLNIPIFNGRSAARGVRTAKVRKLQSELSLDVAKNQLYKDINQAYVDAKGALERYRSAEASVTANAKAFDYASSSFNAGASNSVDYNTAKNNLLLSQSMMMRAKYEYLFKMKVLDYYQLIPITL